MRAWIDRVGRALVAPRQALRDTDQGQGGSSDALVLLGLKFVCGEARFLVAAGWTLLVLGPGAALPALGARLTATLGVDLVLILVGGLAVTVAAGRRRAPGRDFELACTAWVPVLVVDCVGSLAVQVLGLAPGPRVARVSWGLALVWMGALIVLAVRQARARSAR